MLYKSIMERDKLIQYINKNLNKEETEAVEKWINSSQDNFNFFAKFKSDYVFSTLPNEMASEDFNFPSSKNEGKSKSENNILRVITRIAAILFIPLLIYSLNQYFNIKEVAPANEGAAISELVADSYSEYFVNAGVKGKIVLPDSSIVWLNSKSSLKCPKTFDPKMRIVEMDGEGFFDVKSNSKWPMYIKTSKGIIVKVIGTSFNISSYKNDNNFKITLLSGKVEIFKNEKLISNSIEQNKEFIIADNSDTGNKSDVKNINNSISWKDGILVFDNTPMNDVVKKLERWYGVSITINNEKILNYRFTATFSSESISQVLDFFKITSNIEAEFKNKNNIILN